MEGQKRVFNIIGGKIFSDTDMEPEYLPAECTGYTSVSIAVAPATSCKVEPAKTPPVEEVAQ